MNPLLVEPVDSKQILLNLIILFFTFSLEGSLYHSQKEENIAPFDEFILTWNGKRPENDKINFYVRLKTDAWSPYFLYATWGKSGQNSYRYGTDIRVDQDVISTKTKATGFEIKVEGANPKDFCYHVYVNQEKTICHNVSNLGSIRLDVPGLSQKTLDHPRKMDLCSPTSSTAVIRYLSNASIDPVLFAENVCDSGFDIYGNWILNVAEASSILDSWHCWVERLCGFEELHARLMKNTPVVVSVRGPLKGSALPYAKGHLLVVKGYDAEKNMVLCMDPAFPTNEETNIAYPLSDFMAAWERRGLLSYIFEKK
ncbi:MAG TPA: C39 family peptidase [Chlamydiales bacterium]|nr:C39 family peptidase [Chlamydiales bacterium]